MFLYPSNVWDISSSIALRVAKVYLQLIGQIFDDGKCYFNFWLEGGSGTSIIFGFMPPTVNNLKENIQKPKREFIAENCIHSIAVSMGCPSSIDLVAHLAANGDLDQGMDLEMLDQGWVLLHDMSWVVYIYIYDCVDICMFMDIWIGYDWIYLSICIYFTYIYICYIQYSSIYMTRKYKSFGQTLAPYGYSNGYIWLQTRFANSHWRTEMIFLQKVYTPED